MTQGDIIRIHDEHAALVQKLLKIRSELSNATAFANVTRLTLKCGNYYSDAAIEAIKANAQIDVAKYEKELLDTEQEFSVFMNKELK